MTGPFPLMYSYEVTTDEFVLTYGASRMIIPLDVMKEFGAKFVAGENVSNVRPIEVGAEKLTVFLNDFGVAKAIVRGHAPFETKPEELWADDETKALRAAHAAVPTDEAG